MCHLGDVVLRRRHPHVMKGTQPVDKSYMLIKDKRLAKGWSQEDLAAAFETDIESLNKEREMPQTIDSTTRSDAKQNRRALRLHLWAFAIVLSVLTALNVFLTPGDWWIM